MTGPIKAIIKELDRNLAKLPSICQKGCAHCCYQAATIADYEEAPIKSFIKKRLSMKMKSTIRIKAMEWLERYDDIYDHIDPVAIQAQAGRSEPDGYAVYQAVSMELSKAGLPCPFLVNNQCAIYPVRPLSCRIHGQVDDLEACQSNLLRENALVFKSTAEPYFQKIKAVLTDSKSRSVQPLQQSKRPIVHHRHLVPVVRQELMIKLQMRHAPTLQILI